MLSQLLFYFFSVLTIVKKRMWEIFEQVLVRMYQTPKSTELVSREKWWKSYIETSPIIYVIIFHVNSIGFLIGEQNGI